MKIYGDVISPFVRMTLVTAHEVGLEGRFEHVPTSVKPTEVNARLAALNPIGKIPVLETDHNHAVHDSRVIIEYLCHVAGNSTFIPHEGVSRFRVLTLLALAAGLADAAVAYRYETALRPKELRWQDWLARMAARINAALDDLEQNWQPCLAELNAGSIAVAVALSYLDFRLPEIDWRKGRAKLAGFYEDFSRRDSMVKTKLG